jgi:hypothetical protein
MQKMERVVILASVIVVFAGMAGVATAHETTTVNGYELTFGGSDEPVITDERMWMQVEIIHAETGEPVEGIADSMSIAVQQPFGNDTLDTERRASWRHKSGVTAGASTKQRRNGVSRMLTTTKRRLTTRRSEVTRGELG